MKQAIKAILGYKDMTVVELSRLLGKSQQNFNQMLNRDNFRESELSDIATALNCDLVIQFVDRDTGKIF